MEEVPRNAKTAAYFSHKFKTLSFNKAKYFFVEDMTLSAKWSFECFKSVRLRAWILSAEEEELAKVFLIRGFQPFKNVDTTLKSDQTLQLTLD